MDDFKKLTEQLLKIYINAESVDNFGIENYFDENISLIGTGKHELFTNLHEFLESFKFDVKRRGKIRIEVQNLHQIEERLDDDHVLAHGTVDFVGLFKDGSICFKMETRFTIIYKWTNGKWLVQHLHQSIPDLEQMDGEEFPVTLGKQVKKTRQAFHALGTAYYLILRLNLKTKRVEFVKKNRKINKNKKTKKIITQFDERIMLTKTLIANTIKNRKEWRKIKVKSIQQWMPFDEILDNGIIRLKENKYIKIIEVEPINYNLKSNFEKEAILNSFKSFLKTCQFDMQIIIKSKKENLIQHINSMKKNQEKEKPEIKKIINKYIQNIEQLNAENKSDSKQFYIVIGHEIEGKKDNYVDQLQEKTNKIRDNLSRCGNKTSSIKSKEEIEKILYNYFYLNNENN